MAASFLKKVVKEKKAELEKTKKKTPLDNLLQAMVSLPPVRNFREGLFASPRLGVIAEIKRAMPGAPSWKPRIQAEKLVRAYEAGGALAISLVTDEKYFSGSVAHVAEVKKITGLPVLRKDFVVDTYQIYESRAARADALLLIAEALPDKELPRFVEITNGLGMTPVVEVHTAPDLKRAVRAGADVILINNRDLNTLKVNMQTLSRLEKMVPKDVSLIAASGYKSRADLEAIHSDRVRAVLIGKALIEQKAPDQFLRGLMESPIKL